MTELLIYMIVFMGPRCTLPSWKTSIEIDLVQGGSISRNIVELDNFCTKIWFPGPGNYYTTSSFFLFFFNPILLALERHPYPKLNELSVGKKLFFTQSLLFLQWGIPITHTYTHFFFLASVGCCTWIFSYILRTIYSRWIKILCSWLVQKPISCTVYLQKEVWRLLTKLLKLQTQSSSLKQRIACMHKMR